MKKPLYYGPFDNVVEVLMDEYAITRADQPKNVLATYGIGPCVSFSGYSKEKNVGFLTHNSNLDGMKKSRRKLTYEVLKALGTLQEGEVVDFDVRIANTVDRNSGIIDYIKNTLIKYSFGPHMKLNLVEIDRESRNIALDTRNGNVFEYDPMKNSHRREIGKLDEVSMHSNSSYGTEAVCIHRVGDL